MPNCNHCGRFINTSAPGWVCGCEGERASYRATTRPQPSSQALLPVAPTFTPEESLEMARYLKSRLTLTDYMHELRAGSSGMFLPEITRAYARRLTAIESAARKCTAVA